MNMAHVRARTPSSLFYRQLTPYICTRCAHHLADQQRPLIFEQSQDRAIEVARTRYPSLTRQLPTSKSSKQQAQQRQKRTQRPRLERDEEPSEEQPSPSSQSSPFATPTLLDIRAPPQTQPAPPPASFASYAPSTPIPTSEQLHYARRFFTRAQPNFLFSSTHFRTFPSSLVPEVAFLGRSNVGKSSLVNALLNREAQKIASVSSKPGRTKCMNAFGVGPREDGGVRLSKEMVRVTAEDGETLENGDKKPGGGKMKAVRNIIGRGGLTVLDMPGYGKGSAEEWGPEIVKYLTGRKHLRRVFVLIDSRHGIKASDEQLFTLLRQNQVTHQIVLTKIDELLMSRSQKDFIPPHRMRIVQEVCDKVRLQVQKKIKGELDPLDDILTCSSLVPTAKGSGNKIGMDNLRWAVLSASGLDCAPDGSRRAIDYNVAKDLGDELRPASLAV